MKIAIFTETFLPSTDGIVTRLLATIEHLQKQQHELMIFAPEGGPTEYLGAPVIPVRGVPYFFYPQLKFCLPTKLMGNHLRNFRPDLIHVINPVILGLGGIFYAKRMRLPLVASFHTHLAAYAHTYHVPFLDPVAWTFLKNVHNLADVNLATSMVMVDELNQHHFHNVRWWQGGVDTHRFHPDKRSFSMRSRLTDGKPDQLILLYVGRLAHEKGLHRLRPLLDHFPEISIAFIGDGPGRAKLEQIFAGTRSRFLGFLHGDELAAAYASADAFIFPSTTETLGLVLLEAMSSGLPIIAAESRPTKELLQGSVAGMLYTPEDEQSIFTVVRNLLDNVNDRQQASLEARSLAEQRNWSSPTMQLLHYYESALRLYRMRHSKVKNVTPTKKKKLIQV